MKLRKDGHRITSARSAIIHLLVETDEPLSASKIRSTLKLQRLSLDRATIYRELKFLLTDNIVRKIQFAGKATHYEIESGHHHHLICVKCNSVKIIVLGRHLERHERQIYKKENFRVISHALEFYGLCRKCQVLS